VPGPCNTLHRRAVQQRVISEKRSEFNRDLGQGSLIRREALPQARQLRQLANVHQHDETLIELALTDPVMGESQELHLLSADRTFIEPGKLRLERSPLGFPREQLIAVEQI